MTAAGSVAVSSRNTCDMRSVPVIIVRLGSVVYEVFKGDNSVIRLYQIVMRCDALIDTS